MTRRKLNRPFKGLAARLRRQQEERTESPRSDGEAGEPSAVPSPAASFAEQAEREGVSPLAPAPRRVELGEPTVGPGPRPIAEPAPPFDVAADDTRIEGVRADTPPELVARLRGLAPSATLDLHRMSYAEAERAVGRFVRARARRGDEAVLVVVGKGRGSPDGGVLRASIADWLSGPGCAASVRAFVTAPARHGGQGAVLVALVAPARR